VASHYPAGSGAIFGIVLITGRLLRSRLDREALVRALRRWSPVWGSVLLALFLGVVWARFLAGVGGDLAAQWFWADFAAAHPESAYDLAWYGGIHPASYSLLAPYLMAGVGVRSIGVLSVVASAALLAGILMRAGVRWPLVTALWGAFALWCDVAAGRITFAIGLAFGLAALLVAGAERAPSRRRIAAAAGLSLLAVLASPLAGLFVEVAAAALLLTGRRRAGIALAVPGPVVVLLTTVLFPSAGVDPVLGSTISVTAFCALAVALLVPARFTGSDSWNLVRVGGVLYAAGAGLTLLIPTPLGGNVQRLALIFGGVVFLAALCARNDAPWSRLRILRSSALFVSFGIAAYWTVSGDLVGIPVPSSRAQGAGLVAELRRLHVDASGSRVEAVPMLNHWESWGLLGVAELARGWNRQADVQRNHLFYDAAITGPEYHDWLRKWSVGYVAVPALPSGGLDYSARTEAALIATRPAWLHEVWHDRSWRLLQVTDAVAMVAAPARVVHAGAAQVVLDVSAPGPVTVRVQWSPWLRVDGPAGACLAEDGDWTLLVVRTPGRYAINGDYQLPRGSRCARH
jgi:hypothetical protein